jgi:hypothetical protein
MGSELQQGFRWNENHTLRSYAASLRNFEPVVMDKLAELRASAVHGTIYRPERPRMHVVIKNDRTIPEDYSHLLCFRVVADVLKNRCSFPFHTWCCAYFSVRVNFLVRCRSCMGIYTIRSSGRMRASTTKSFRHNLISGCSQKGRAYNSNQTMRKP